MRNDTYTLEEAITQLQNNINKAKYDRDYKKAGQLQNSLNEYLNLYNQKSNHLNIEAELAKIQDYVDEKLTDLMKDIKYDVQSNIDNFSSQYEELLSFREHQNYELHKLIQRHASSYITTRMSTKARDLMYSEKYYAKINHFSTAYEIKKLANMQILQDKAEQEKLLQNSIMEKQKYSLTIFSRHFNSFKHRIELKQDLIIRDYLFKLLNIENHAQSLFHSLPMKPGAPFEYTSDFKTAMMDYINTQFSKFIQTLENHQKSFHKNEAEVDIPLFILSKKSSDKKRNPKIYNSNNVVKEVLPINNPRAILSFNHN